MENNPQPQPIPLNDVIQMMYARRCMVHHLWHLFQTYYLACDADTLESFAATIASAMRSVEEEIYYDWNEQPGFDLPDESDGGDGEPVGR